MTPQDRLPWAGLRNEPQLITYADRLAGDLRGLNRLLRGELAGAIGGVHLLPFYYPIDGSDAGFDPIDHLAVDARLGEWKDVGRIAADFDVVADLIVNHVSADSAQFIDWLQNGAASAYDGMFLTFDGVFPDGASNEDLAGIYRPRPGLPFTTYRVCGVERRVWTTFTANQIDIDVGHAAAWGYLVSVLERFAAAGVKLVRLDAVGYAVKQSGTSCFMLPETFDFISRLREECRRRGMRTLVEIHSHFRTQIAIAKRVDLVYDFALPPLILHAIHAADAEPLGRWLQTRPDNCVTVLDTHDGIGVIDVAPDGEEPGLLEPDQVDRLVDSIHAASGGDSRRATGAAASNLDLYQVNCTFFEALGSDPDAHLLARLIQVLVPGIPQVYYAGLLASRNDTALLERTGVGRDINRPYYDGAALAGALERPIVEATLCLLRWRAAEAELFNGRFESALTGPRRLVLRWFAGSRTLEARIDLKTRTFEIDLDARTITQLAQLDA